jgi:hypothetical protein
MQQMDLIWLTALYVKNPPMQKKEKKNDKGNLLEYGPLK